MRFHIKRQVKVEEINKATKVTLRDPYMEFEIDKPNKSIRRTMWFNTPKNENITDICRDADAFYTNTDNEPYSIAQILYKILISETDAKCKKFLNKMTVKLVQ